MKENELKRKGNENESFEGWGLEQPPKIMNPLELCETQEGRKLIQNEKNAFENERSLIETKNQLIEIQWKEFDWKLKHLMDHENSPPRIVNPLAQLVPNILEFFEFHHPYPSRQLN